MEKYAKVLRRRNRAFALLFLIILALLGLQVGGVLLPDGGSHANSFLAGFQVGLLVGLALVAVVLMLKNYRALRNPTLLEKMHIDETDERNRMIREKTGGFAFTVYNLALALAAIAMGYFSFVAFVTAIGICLSFSLLRLALQVYYNKKY